MILWSALKDGAIGALGNMTFAIYSNNRGMNDISVELYEPSVVVHRGSFIADEMSIEACKKYCEDWLKASLTRSIEEYTEASFKASGIANALTEIQSRVKNGEKT